MKFHENILVKTLHSAALWHQPAGVQQELIFMKWIRLFDFYVENQVLGSVFFVLYFKNINHCVYYYFTQIK